MLRSLKFGVMFWFAWTFVSSESFGQQIRVVKDSDAADQWTVSYSRKGTPDVFELDSIQSSEAEANKRITAIRAWNAHMDPPGTSLAIAVILVEAERVGAVAKPKKDDGGQPILKLKPNTKPGDVLKEYKQAVQAAYARAAAARKNLIATTNRVAEFQFRDVNRIIDDFNSLRGEAISATGDAFASTPAIARIAESDLKAPIVRDIKAPELKWVEVGPPIFSKYDRDVDVISQPARKNETPSKPKAVMTSVAGKRGDGSLGKTKATIDFDKNGTFSVRDERDNEIASGKWSQSGSEIHFASTSYVYVGNVGKNLAKGIRMLKGQRLSSSEEEWSLQLKDLPPPRYRIEASIHTNDKPRSPEKGRLGVSSDGYMEYYGLHNYSGNRDVKDWYDSLDEAVAVGNRKVAAQNAENESARSRGSDHVVVVARYRIVDNRGRVVKQLSNSR